jgi:hypothetical protein
MQDDAAMSETQAPDLCGLSPDQAALVCYEQAVALTVSVADMVEGGIRRSCV